MQKRILMYVLVAALFVTSIGLALLGEHAIAVPLFAYAMFGALIVGGIIAGRVEVGPRRDH